MSSPDLMHEAAPELFVDYIEEEVPQGWVQYGGAGRTLSSILRKRYHNNQVSEAERLTERWDDKWKIVIQRGEVSGPIYIAPEVDAYLREHIDARLSGQDLARVGD